MKKIFKKHFKWYAEKITADKLDAAAAHGAFFLIISFLPFVAFLLTLMQQIHFSSGASLIDLAMGIFPEDMAAYIYDLLPDPFTAGSVMPVAVIAALWSSSMGMLAVIQGLGVIFDTHGTIGFIRLRIIAIIYVVLFAFALLAAAGLLVFGSSIYNFLLSKSPPFFATILINFKSLAGFLLLFLIFILLYSVVPKAKVRFVHNIWGAAFSSGGWVLFSYLFSLFVETFSGFSIYGGLATLVMLMVWLFCCMYILFLGAEVSMWLEHSGIGADLKNWYRERKKKKPESTKKSEKSP